MTSSREVARRREQQLRRLLSEAVEPVEPAAGAQTRLLARARAQAQRKSRGPLILRWGAPVVLASLAIAVVVTLVFAIHSGSGSNSSASTSAGGATAGSGRVRQTPPRPPPGRPRRPLQSGAPLNPSVPSPQLDSGKSATTYGDASSGQRDHGRSWPAVDRRAPVSRSRRRR